MKRYLAASMLLMTACASKPPDDVALEKPMADVETAATPQASLYCLGSTIPVITASQRGKVKFYPGHYVAIGGASTGPFLKDTATEIATIPNIVGIQKRYAWSDLQTKQGEYDFTLIKNDIETMKAKGKKLSIMVMWKFDNAKGESPVPQYLASLTDKPFQYELGGEGKGEFAKGHVAAFDNPVVVKEFSRFLQKLRDVVDQDPAVANIVFPETAMGVDFKRILGAAAATHEDVIRDGHINGILEWNKRAACMFKKTPVVQLTNGPINRLKEMTETYVKHSIGMGGPDVWTKDDSLERPNPAWPKRAYDYYPDVEAQLPIGLIVAGGNYLFPEHYPETISDPAARAKLTHEALSGWNESRTTLELAKKATDQLKANYIWWKKNGAKGDKFYQAFLAHIKKMGTPDQTIGPAKSECPSAYICAVAK